VASIRRLFILIALILGAFVIFGAGRLSSSDSRSVEAQTIPDHFQCYRIFGTDPPNVVQLKDQFSTDIVQVNRARLLCAPVAKTHLQGTPPPQPFTGDHLKCYEVDPHHAAVQNNLVTLRNQFGIEQHVKIERAEFLCVPTEKIVELDGSCDLTINKVSFPGVPTGGTITYQIQVTWNCPFPSPAPVEVRDFLPTVPFNPPVIIPPTPQATQGSCTTVNNPIIDCNLGIMQPNTSVAITISLDVGGNNPALINVAVVDPNNLINESNEGNNTDTTFDFNCC
jgi:hypothetical protein